MKTSSLLLLSTVANAATLWPRQFGLGSRFGNVVKLASVVDLTPEVQPAAKHVIQRFGPITLKGVSQFTLYATTYGTDKLSQRGYSKDSGQQNFMFSIPQNAFCRDCTVLKGRVGLADLNAVPIVPKTGSGVYIHHILTYDTSKSSKPFVSNCLSLMGGFLGSKFIGSGEDNNNVPVWYTSQDGSLAGGFHIGRSDRFTMNADLVSMNSESSQVYITMELEYLTGQVGSDARETLLNIGSCGGGRLRTSTSGPTNTTSGQYTFKEDGKIILGKGHMHVCSPAFDGTQS